jgi:arylsulfatase A-like enzyme
VPRRAGAAGGLAIVALALASTLAPAAPASPPLPPNVLLVITDDQTADMITAMPWLSSRLTDASSGWVAYPNAVVATPMCCPSRASILTGLVAERTGVVDNGTGARLDDSDTLATRLRDAGYRTGLIGKYLNGYPWDDGPYVPPGWDRWFAKANEALETTYYGYPVVDQGAWRRFGTGPGDYVTDVLGREALDFVRTAPTDRPWFLVFSPPAPHAPWTAAPRDESTVVPPGDPIDTSVPPDAPAWMRTLPAPDPEEMAEARRDAEVTLLAVDGYLHDLSDAVTARGEWDRTVVIVLSDNGYHFGERGWVGKAVPYEPSIAVPFVARWPPGLQGPPPTALVSNIDIAPTVDAIAGLPPAPADGRSLLDPVPPDRTIPLWWVGDADVPAWRGVRGPTAVWIRWSTGEEELFDLGADPRQLHNLIDEPAAAGMLAGLRGTAG